MAVYFVHLFPIVYILQQTSVVVGFNQILVYQCGLPNPPVPMHALVASRSVASSTARATASGRSSSRWSNICAKRQCETEA